MKRDGFSSVDPVLLERLVDGELDNDARRTLLESFDDDPAAWRACALAFLETQACKAALAERPMGAMRGSCPSQSISSQGASSQNASRAAQRARLFTLATAAGLLLAFGAGLSLGRVRSVEPAVAAADQQTLPPNTRDAQREAPTSTPSRPRDSNTVAVHSKGHIGGTRQQSIATVERQANTLRVPVVSRTELDPQLLVDHQSALSSDSIAELRQLGVDVRSQRQTWPIQLEDGRQLILPVEQVEVHYPQATYH